ncbi:hypothetical protein [Streptomyces sp. 7N604]|uniref:hypothetical protein n=1 Tax=Streptomyces sp. 7N604 TaxID=3457415 RepID=UPI003FD10170
MTGQPEEPVARTDAGLLSPVRAGTPVEAAPELKDRLGTEELAVLGDPSGCTGAAGPLADRRPRPSPHGESRGET